MTTAVKRPKLRADLCKNVIFEVDKMKNQTRNFFGGFWKKGVWLLATVVVLFMALLFYRLGSFYNHLDKFSLHIKIGEEVYARQELEILRTMHPLVLDWGWGWLHRKTGELDRRYLMREHPLYEGSYGYLIGNYGAVISVLQDVRDKHLAAQMLGAAKFRLAQAEYQKVTDVKVRESIVKQVLSSVSNDFERAVRHGPSNHFDHQWNYDLTSNKDQTEKALSGQNPKANFVLGYPEGQRSKAPDGTGDKKGVTGVPRINEKSDGAAGFPSKKIG